MSKFKISAPGRIVLSGEHAVMYGKQVVMASLDRRTTLKFVELINDPRNIIKIEFPDVNLSLNLPLEEVVNIFSSDYFIDMTDDHSLLLRHVQYFITSNGMWCTYEQKFSLQTFFFLLYFIAYYEELDIKSFHVHLTTQLPIGAGLGSSSSFAVCLAACFMHWARLQRGFHNNFNEQELSKISMYAMFCEEAIQNYFFGDDNDICCYGKIVKSYYNNEVDHDIRILDVPRMKILLVDLKIRLNKFKRAKQIAELKYSHPESVDPYLNRFDVISEDICGTLAAIANSYTNRNYRQLENLYTALQISIQMNQVILSDLNMSHPKLDTICSIAQHFGFTGNLAGFGGGFAYILLSFGTPEEQITNLSTHLMALGFSVTLTSVSCRGVTIDDSLY